VKAVFLDRDGVINHDPGDYTRSVKEFHILPDFLAQAKKWYDRGYILIVITNQGGIAKGLYTKNHVDAMHQFLQGKCIEAGFRIKDFYYCPHHEAFSGKCLCRKPGSLMVEKALHQYHIDPEASVFFGDKERDISCAIRAGVKGFKIDVNSSIPSPEELNMA
jgi:D-glycero-D-manno-heptose 1,7-bisphosphate phosphatase